MTVRTERIKENLKHIVRDASSDDILFLRYGRSAEPDLFSAADPIVRNLKKRGRASRIESFSPGNDKLTDLVRLIRLIRRYQTIHLLLELSTSQIGIALPALILSRFFGRRFILSFVGPVDDPPFGKFSRHLPPVLNLCDRITVSSSHHLRLLKSGSVRTERLAQVIEPISVERQDGSPIVPTILVALPLEEFSNIPAAIKAVELVKQKYPRTQMVIFGDGSQKDRLEAIAGMINHDAIRIESEQSPESYARCLQEADIFLCSSVHNHLSPSLVHALQFGIPIVAVVNSVITEMISDGESGLLTARGDHVALADKLFQLIESEELRRELTDKGRKAVAHLDWKKAREEWCSLYS